MPIITSRRAWSRLATPLLTLGLLSTTTLAQTAPNQDIRPTELRTHAISGATVVVQPGRSIDNATIVIRDGVIEAVGPNVRVPASAKRWDGQGLTVYPGLIDPAVMVSAESPSGAGAHWNRQIHPQINMVDQPAIDTSLREELRSIGFTAAAVYPSSGILRGTGVVLAMADENENALSYLDRAMMAAAFDRGGGYPGSLMGSIAMLRQTLYDALWYQQSEGVYEHHPEGNEPPIRADALAALAKVIDREQQVLFEVSDELNALRAARIADEFNIDLILLGSGMEFRRLREVADTNLPVILPLDFPDAPDASTLAQAERVSLRDLMTWEQAPTNARRLVDAGVPVALTTHDLSSRGDFFSAVRSAIRHGLTEDAALAAMTIVPAQMLGLEHVMGTIEAGKIANFVVVDGSIFERDSKVLDTWINGRRYEINERPGPKIVGAGTLRTDRGVKTSVTINTEKKMVSVELDGDETARAKDVSFEADRLSFLLDGRLFDVDGYVHLSGAYTAGSVTGMGMLPDGRRFAFEISDIHEDEAAENAEGPDAEAEAEGDERRPGTRGGVGRRGGGGGGRPGAGTPAAPDRVSGVWQARMLGNEAPPEAANFNIVLHVTEDSASGSVESEFFAADLVDGRFDRATNAGTFKLDSEEFAAEVSVRIEGSTMTGTIGAGDMSMDFSATRVSAAGGSGSRGGGDEEDDANFIMPPDELVFPLGAYGLSEPPARQNVLISGATIWTAGPRGVIEDGWMTVQDGRITGIGSGQFTGSTGADWVSIDATGKHLSPGLLDCHSHTGVSGGVNEMGQTITAEVRIADVINPDDINWYRQLAGGLTACNQLHGSANPIGGQNSVVKLKWGGDVDDHPILSAIPGIKFALGENVVRSEQRYPNTRMGVEAVFRDAFTAAREYEAEWQRYEALPDAERARTMPPRRDIEMDTLVEILNGERLVHCHSYRQDEILMLIRVAEEFGFTIGTFQHVLEGYKIAEAIGAHGAGASSFSDWWAYKVEVMDAIPYNGALMTNVGVLVSFNSDSSELARRMNTEAAKAVRYGGLDPHEALKLVTYNPAKQLRVHDRIGSLEVGKDADFVIWSDAPLSTYARCEQTWIEGARYFDLELDQHLREITRMQRKRLIQKLLAKKHGEAPATSAEDDTTDTTASEVNR